MRTRPGATQLDRLLDLDARSARQIGSYRLVVYLTAATLLLLIGLALRGAHRSATATALVFASLPLATFLMRLLPNTPSNAVTLGLTAAIAAAVAVAASGVGRTRRGALTAVLIATAAVVGIDGATGGWLHTTTMLGLLAAGRRALPRHAELELRAARRATVLAAGLAIERHGRDALPAVAVAFVSSRCWTACPGSAAIIALALFYLGPLLSVLRAEERTSRENARYRRPAASSATSEGLPTW